MLSVYLQTSDSSGTITSTSSMENDGDPDKDGGYKMKGDKSALFYSALLEDDDSGIVMRTSSHTSLDQYKGDNTPSFSSDSSKVDKLPPPKPLPRKSMSPSVVTVDDKLIRPRERPQPAPRKHSFGSSETKPCGDVLIDLDAKTPENEIADLSDDFNGMNSAGDYVLLREPKSNKSYETAENRRISITRTPALKLGQDETPKRPSIRRERSPITPEEPKAPGTILDFDPLFDSGSSTSVTQNNSNASDGNQQIDDSDSLLKDWNIGGLTALGQSSKQNLSQTNYSYGTPTIPPRKPTNTGMQRFYTPQPYMTNTQTASSSVGFQNPMSQPRQTPHVAPRPKSRQNMGSGQQSAKCLFPSQTSATKSANQSDPFAGLVSLNQSENTKSANQSSSNMGSQPGSNWETFN